MGIIWYKKGACAELFLYISHRFSFANIKEEEKDCLSIQKWRNKENRYMMAASRILLLFFHMMCNVVKENNSTTTTF
jgi:hypothetical protein